MTAFQSVNVYVFGYCVVRLHSADIAVCRMEAEKSTQFGELLRSFQNVCAELARESALGLKTRSPQFTVRTMLEAFDDLFLKLMRSADTNELWFSLQYDSADRGKMLTKYQKTVYTILSCHRSIANIDFTLLESDSHYNRNSCAATAKETMAVSFVKHCIQQLKLSSNKPTIEIILDTLAGVPVDVEAVLVALYFGLDMSVMGFYSAKSISESDVVLLCSFMSSSWKCSTLQKGLRLIVSVILRTDRKQMIMKTTSLRHPKDNTDEILQMFGGALFLKQRMSAFVGSAPSVDSVRGLAAVLLSRGCMHSALVDVVVSAFPIGVPQLALASAYCDAWGDRRTICSGDTAKLEYLTLSLLKLLPSFTAEDLANRAVGSPLVITLSGAVSSYLDMSDARLRHMGMKVAVAFSAVMGHPLRFDELDDANANADATELSVKDNNALHEQGKEKDVNNDYYDDEDDDDDDDEFVPFSTPEDIRNEAQNGIPESERKYVTPYLLQCLKSM